MPFEDDLFALVEPLVAPVRLIWSDQSAMRPAKPYATLDIGSAGIAPYLMALGPDENGITTYVEHRVATVETQFFGGGAMQRASLLGMRLRLPAATHAAHALNLGVHGLEAPIDATALMGETQYEERSIFEFRVQYAEAIDVDNGLVEHVEINVDPPEPPPGFSTGCATTVDSTAG